MQIGFRLWMATLLAMPMPSAWAGVTPEGCDFTPFGTVIHDYEAVPPIEGMAETVAERSGRHAEGYKRSKAVLVPGKSWEPTEALGGGWNDYWASRFRRWRHFWRPNAETYPRFHRDKGVEELVEGLVAQIRNPDLLAKTVTTSSGEKPWPNRAPELIQKLEKWLGLPRDVERIASEAFAHEYNLRHLQAAKKQAKENGYVNHQGLEVPWVVVKSDGKLEFSKKFITVNEIEVTHKLEMAGIRKTFGRRPTDALIEKWLKEEGPLPLTRGFKEREREQAELQRVLTFVSTQLNHLRHAEPEAMQRGIPGAEGTRFEGKTYEDLYQALSSGIDRSYSHLRGQERRDHLVRHETSRARSEMYWKEFWSEFRSIFNIRRAQKEASEFTQARLDEFAANPGASVTQFANSIRDPDSWRNLGKTRSWLRGLVVFAGGITLGATALGTFYTLTIKPGMEAWSTVRKWTDPVDYCAARFKDWEYEDCIKEWVQVAYLVEFRKSRYDPDYTPFQGRPEALEDFEAQMRRFAAKKTQYHSLYDKALTIVREEEKRIKAMEAAEQQKMVEDLAKKLASESTPPKKDTPPVTP